MWYLFALHQVPVTICLKLQIWLVSDLQVSPNPGRVFLPSLLYAFCIHPYTKYIPCFKFCISLC